MKDKKQEETLLTVDLYSSLVEKITGEIINLKKEQGDCISTISTQKEVLKNLKKELCGIKKNIKISKKNLKEEKKDLYKINNAMSLRSDALMRLNDEFLLSEESYINSSNCLNIKTSKQKKIN
ncbi:MAG: hypothetical protein E7174_04855 [Firmicutes bacterium]|nr:hypothetical protein [Bacillota bacterium]